MASVLHKIARRLNQSEEPDVVVKAQGKKPPGVRLGWFRRASAPLRTLPGAVVIGVQKGGTTSLYRYLIRHPHVMWPKKKEMHFFDRRYAEGLDWYRAHFPTRAWQRIREATTGQRHLVIEATPGYVFHPWSADLLAKTLPNARLVLMLRNPVDRAYSHYKMMVRREEEPRSFGEVIEDDFAHIDEHRAFIASQPIEKWGRNARKKFYLARGLYAEQLAPWLEQFDREQLYIMSSDSFYQDTPGRFRDVIAFLGLDAWEPPKYTVWGKAATDRMDPAVRQALAEFYRAPNEKLFALLGEDYGWNSP